MPNILADGEKRPAAGYCMAWLQVAGGNSVLPPWVRYRFPELSTLIKALREDPCGNPECANCAENHDPEGQLERFFGYPSFREEPRTIEGESLQRDIVNSCMGDHCVLGILPTGVGKAAKGVAIATYHGVAMRLAGISIRDMAASHNKDNIDFDRIIKDAVQFVKGEKDIYGIEPDEHRDRLLAGYSHILVDEYQDIDEDQYDLVSPIAGRSLSEDEGRLSILAVGDDE
ncbi:MAG: AAA family ATPase [Desulfatitalea sp.]|nr:AAA family ATPase [Desulfatitalea sp.]NNK01931.1 AAA family ATPase [Desulfatitalea sp.]